jgi:allantoinase
MASIEPPYSHWPIQGRPEIGWPGGKRLACYIGLNIEHYEIGRPATSRTTATAGLPFDPLNYGWRDYGARVGFWRTLGLLDKYELPASVLLNADAALRYPEIVKAGVERDWAFLGHGRTNSRLWTGLDIETERRELQRIALELTRATGRAPRGWLGPALTETENTVALLAELGFTYSLDWTADDEPFPMNAPAGKFISVPYSIEINDVPVFVDQGLTPAQFTQMIVDQFEVMHEEAVSRPGAVFCLSLHTFLVGQPFRHKHLAEALMEITGFDDVWYTTSDEIASWYLENYYDSAVKTLSVRR